MKKRILFVCTHNSARSQMAEGMLRQWGGDAFEAFSAGTQGTGVKPEAVAVMAELDVDIRSQRSKTIGELAGHRFDWFITVCDDAQAQCPVLPGVAHVMHWSIEDPSAADGTFGDRLATFRRARDVIADHVRAFLHAAAGPSASGVRSRDLDPER